MSKGNLWYPSQPLKRDTYFCIKDTKSFPKFQPSYEVNKEKHDMWAVMRMEYQKRWESERDLIRDEYEYYRKEKIRQIQRRYVDRKKIASLRKEQAAQKTGGAAIIPCSRYHNISSVVNSNFSSPMKNKTQVIHKKEDSQNKKTEDNNIKDKKNKPEKNICIRKKASGDQ